MKPPLKGIIFDMDGVLINSKLNIFNWTKYSVEELLGGDFPYKFEDDYYWEIFHKAHDENGLDGVYDLFGVSYSENEELLQTEFKKWHQEHKSPVHKNAINAFTEIYHMLHDRNYDIRFAINSTNSMSNYITQLSDVGFTDIIVGSVTADDLPIRQCKPHPFAVKETLRLLGTDPDETLYLGDTSTDVIACSRLPELGLKKVDVLLCDWGSFETRSRLEALLDKEKENVIDLIDDPEESKLIIYQRCGLF